MARTKQADAVMTGGGGMIKGIAMRLWVAALVWAGLQTAAAAAVPGVVASIPPVHSLAAAVMEGRGSPKLLLPGGASPHATTLKPSDAAALQAAGVVFWIGPDLETFLEKPLQALAGKAKVVALSQAGGIALLPYRQGSAWGPHAHDDHGHGHGKEAHDDHDDESTRDMHLWLDPRNAIAMAKAMAETLAAADPDGAALYHRNATALSERLAALDQRLQQELTPLRGRPFIVFHDAYQYFEARYGLTAVGAVTVSPEHQPSARQVAAIRQKIRDSGAACVFSEPQCPPKLVATVTEGTPARSGVLDPLGAALTPGPAAYPALLQGIADALNQCLAPRPPG
jgi:zinc transport system substrate-binding protein